MKKTIPSFILGLTCGLMLVSFSAVADNITKDITASYKNIKIVIDGETKQTDKEPFIIDGSTYVPLRFISENLGSTINWDDKNSTVNIWSNKDLEFYTLITGEYYELSKLTYSLLMDHMNLSLYALSVSNKSSYDVITKRNNAFTDSFNININNYNEQVKRVNNLVNLSNARGLDLSTMSNLLNDCNNIINDYKTAYQSIDDFQKNNNSNYYWDKFSDYDGKAISSCDSDLVIINSEYLKYWNMCIK